MIPSAPKFRKIVLLLTDDDNKPTTRMEYMDSAMIITGNYVIMSEEETVSVDNPATISGNVYEMKNIHSYKLFKD